MPENNLFIADQHPQSRRFAILEDDGTSAWLYLTAPDSQQPVADVWVYNRIAAPPLEAVKSYRGGPPPAPAGYAGDGALCHDPREHQWSFIWSADGESIAVARDGTPVALVAAGQERGYSRELTKEGPWGRTWSEEVMKKTACPGS